MLEQSRGSHIPPCEPPISGTARLLSMAASWARLSTDIKKKQVTKSVAYGEPLINMVRMARTVHSGGDDGAASQNWVRDWVTRVNSAGQFDTAI